MERYFNLLYEPWIPCIDQNNHKVNYGLRDALAKSNAIKSISTPIPTVTAAMNLLLLAYALAVFPLENEDEWEYLYAQGRFPDESIHNYNHAWQDRFFLFDEQHPFFQDPKLGLREKDLNLLGNGQKPKEKGLSSLLIHLSSGDNATLFDHSVDGTQKVYDISEAAQFLVMLQAYSLGGMTAASIGNDKYYKDAAFSRGILFLNRGENLFESLMLNLIPKEKDTYSQEEGDRPCWEIDDSFEVDRGSPLGLKDLLTWQSRRVLLIPIEKNGNFYVQECFVAPGLGLVESFANPFYHNSHNIKGNKQTIQPMRFQTSRAIWRDSDAILETNIRDKNNPVDPPITTLFFDNLIAAEIIQKTIFRLNLFGMCTQPGQKKVFFYNHEYFDAPAVYLENQALLNKLKLGLSWVEDGRRALYSATYLMASYKIDPNQDSEGSSPPNRDSVNPLYEHINTEALYWSRLEPDFYQFLNQLPATDEALPIWQEAIRSAAKVCLAASTKLVGDDPAALKAIAKAEVRLAYNLNQIFNPPK